MKKSDKKLLKSLPAQAKSVATAVKSFVTPKDPDYGKAFKKLAFKTAENMASVKFYILVVSTAFFYFGKLSEGTWQETVLIVAGLRAINEAAAVFKKEPKDESKKSEA